MKKPFSNLLKVALLAIGCTLAGTLDAQAQNRVRAGIKGGFNASTLSQNIDDRRERYGFHGGIFAQVPAGQFFAIQPELLYTTKGVSGRYDVLGFQGRNSFRINYAEVPVLATFKLGNAVELQAGPYASYLLSADAKSEADRGSSTVFNLNRNDFNTVDYGVAGGLNVYFGKVLVGVRYNQGLRQVANSQVAETFLGNSKNGVGMVTLGYSFN